MRTPTGSSGPRRTRILATLLLVASLLALWAPIGHAEGVVHLYYFHDPHCEVCHEVHEEVIEPLLAEHGERLQIEEISIAETGNFALLLGLEQAYGVASGSIPEVFIGDRALIGAEEIGAELEALIAQYLAEGGVALPTAPGPTPATTPPPAECDECDGLHAAAQAAAATRRAAEGAEGAVQAVLFWSETCPACHYTREEVLPPIVREFGDRLQIRAVNVTGRNNQDVWDATVAALAIPRDRLYVPMLIVGDRILVGGGEIGADLPGLVEGHLLHGGVHLPAVPGVAFTDHPLYTPPGDPTPPAPASTAGPPPPIHAAYFYQPGCDECERAEHDLAYIQSEYPQLVVERYNVREAATLNQYLCDTYGVPADKHLTAPAFFVGSGYLLDDQVRAPALEALVRPFLTTGSAAPEEGWEEQAGGAVESIVERFRSFGLLTVLGAGLIDGVNPCAFATMIFLVSYLSVRKRKGRELLATGAAFTLGVFLTYLGVGFGLLRVLESLPFLNVIGKWIYGATALLCLALAVGSVLDYRKARAGRLEDMSLKLPARMRGWSRKLIREGTNSRRFVLSALGLGFGVSLVELACTGQVYLPTIIFVLGVPEWRAQASLALLGYNLMFILPLVGVFLLVYYGTTSQQLLAWMQRRAAAVKLGMAGVFVALAGWLVYGIVAY